MGLEKDFHVLMYSESQGCFLIEEMTEMLRNNRRIFREARKVDYIPLALGATRDGFEEIKSQLIKERAKFLKADTED